MQEPSQSSLKEEEKVTLSKTQFMLCHKCKNATIRVKQNKLGFLFAACEGWPQCKYSIWLPKALKNVQVNYTDPCQECEAASRGVVQKLTFEVWPLADPQAQVELQEFMHSCESTFCVVPQCDQNYTALRKLTA